MNTLKVGFSRVNVTPMLGIHIAGYFIERIADGVLDELELNALALEAGGTRVLLMSLDNCGLSTEAADILRASASEACSLPRESVFFSNTHSHTTPYAEPAYENDPLVPQYLEFLRTRVADAAKMAFEDLKPARMGIGVGTAPHIAFIRRYRMKDGSLRTNPGVGNPDILEPVGKVDERVEVLRFDREGGETVVLAGFGDHPDTVGGCKISADWPGFFRRTFEKAIDNTKCIFFNGAEGDINHVNVAPKGGDLNDMFLDFDDVSRGYAHARFMGRVVAGAVMQVYDKVAYRDVNHIAALCRVIRAPSNMPDPSELPLAHRYYDLHHAGKDAEIPFTAMALTTVVAEAERMIALEHGPEAFPMELSAIVIGDVAMLGIPGEPFGEIGRAIKASPDFALAIPCCLTNGAEGYFPTRDCYEEGGYETRSSRFKAGIGEFIVDEALTLLRDAKNA